MDNQQETLKYYIAGLFEGEGSLNICKLMLYGKQLSYRTQIQFTNTEPEICQKFVDYLKSKNYSFHVRQDIRKDKKTCYQIVITKIKDKLAFIEDIAPLFVGKKIKEAEMLKKLILKIQEMKTTKLMINTKGHYEKSTERFPEYEKIYKEYKNIKDSPETTCEAPIFIG